MPKNQEVTISEFYCTNCGNKGISIPRKIGKQREPGHLKKLYCIYCKNEHNFIEIRPFGQKYTKEDFDLEFKYGNFDKEGNRIEPFNQFALTMKGRI